GLDGKREPLTRVEEMAACYIKEIRAVLPEGPFLLGGASFGGRVAFEMARQLHAIGQKVALVALLDAFAPGSPGSLPKLTVMRRRLTSYRARAAFHLRNLLLGPERRKYIWKKSRTLLRRIRNRLWQAMYKSYERMARPLPQVLQNVGEAGYLASRRYRPKTYPGQVTLFRAGVRSIGEGTNNEMGWAKLALGGVVIREVAGDHVNMLVEPHVRTLAEQLRDCIDRATEAEAAKEFAASAV
ncbi:MAG: thioesterase domain-containing protein, partial [Thermoanaerobaculia bacterium]